MNWITVTWTVDMAVCLTVALIYLVIWFNDPKSRVHLLFPLTSLAIAGIAICELQMMLSQTPEQFGWWLRWTHVPVFIAIVSLVWFVRFYLDAGRLWLAWSVCALRSLALVLNFVLSPNLNYTRINSVRQLKLFGGATVSVPEGIPSGWTRVGELASLLLLVFVVDASMTLWRRGNRAGRHRAVIVGGSVALFVIIGGGHTAMIHGGLINSPYIISLAFLVPIAAMGYEVGAEVAQAASLARKLDLVQSELHESEQRMELAEREQLRHRIELSHLSRVAMLGELSGSLAHELNQPLTAILSNAQAAQDFLDQDTTDLDELRGILQDIVEADRRAREVIRRLQLLFHKGEIQNEALDLNELAIEVLKLMNSDLTNHGVTIETELAGSLPSVEGDRVQLQQVLINLIINASDAMSGNDSVDRRLDVATLLDRNGDVEMRVADTGCGIPPEEIERIFDPFHTTKPKGLGLGLAVCRTIISAHSAKLWAGNNRDRGACFHMVFRPIKTGSI